MKTTSDALAAVRRDLQMDAGSFAAFLGLSPEEYELILTDKTSVSPVLVDRCARLLGIPMAEVLRGECGSGLRVMYRKMGENQAVRSSLAGAERGLAIGTIVRQMTRLEGLSTAEGRMPDWTGHRPITEGSTAPHGARELAQEVRENFGLGDGPIESVWALAAQSGVRCATVTPEELSQSIDGASWRVPHPTLVVNLVGGRRTWWRTRMTVIHELAHIWFDLPNQGLILSAEKDSGPLYLHFEQLEQRANAFAAYLLVPPNGVRQMLDGASLSASIVLAVAHRYSVGMETALQTVCNVAHAPWETRARLRDELSRMPLAPSRHADEEGPASPQRQLEEAVGRALSEGQMTTVRARILLGVPFSEPLPDSCPPSKPLIGTFERARMLALRRVHARGVEAMVVANVEVLSDNRLRVRLVPDQSAGPSDAREPIDIVLLESDVAA